MNFGNLFTCKVTYMIDWVGRTHTEQIMLTVTPCATVLSSISCGVAGLRHHFFGFVHIFMRITTFVLYTFVYLLYSDLYRYIYTKDELWALNLVSSVTTHGVLDFDRKHNLHTENLAYQRSYVSKETYI